jgi:ferredoxin
MGVDDFGIGRLTVLANLCLRCAKTPTACDVCVNACPVHALDGDMASRPHPSLSCLGCGICVAACPLSALTGSTRTLQQVNRLILQSLLLAGRLALACERTFALLRLAAESSEQGRVAAEKDLALLAQASASGHLCTLPCLAMLGREICFSALNEADAAVGGSVGIYLPPGQCASCPVNANGVAEALLNEAVATAQAWAGQALEVIERADDLPQSHKASVRAYLSGDSDHGRRSLLAGLTSDLKASWIEFDKASNRQQYETRRQRERSSGFKRTKLWANGQSPDKYARPPAATALRYILIESLGKNPRRAHAVTLAVSATDQSLCTGCGLCVEACPVHARHFAEAAQPAAESGEGAQPASGCGEEPARPGGAIVEATYCVACTACMQICPASACAFDEISGWDFLTH